MLGHHEKKRLVANRHHRQSRKTRFTCHDRTNSAKTLEAEWIALAAVGGTIDDPIGVVNTVPPVPGIRLLAKRDIRLTLVGIELEVVGPHPDGKNFRKMGIDTILDVGSHRLLDSNSRQSIL